MGINGIERQANELAGLLTEVRRRRTLIHRIDSLEDEMQSLAVKLEKTETAGKPEIVEMSDTDLDEFAGQWRTNLQSGTMDKRKAVFRQLIDSAVFDGEELEIAPNLATLTGAEVSGASPRGFEPLLPP